MDGGSFLSLFGDCAWHWQTPLVIWEHSPEATLLPGWLAAGNQVGAVFLLSKPCAFSLQHFLDTYLPITHIINKLNLMVVCS